MPRAADTGAGRPFVGRGEVVESLRRRLENVRAGGGEVTFLLGEAGVGKSALVDLLVAEARSKGEDDNRGREQFDKAVETKGKKRGAVGSRGGDQGNSTFDEHPRNRDRLDEEESHAQRGRVGGIGHRYLFL